MFSSVKESDREYLDQKRKLNSCQVNGVAPFVRTMASSISLRSWHLNINGFPASRPRVVAQRLPWVYDHRNPEPHRGSGHSPATLIGHPLIHFPPHSARAAHVIKGAKGEWSACGVLPMLYESDLHQNRPAKAHLKTNPKSAQKTAFVPAREGFTPCTKQKKCTNKPKCKPRASSRTNVWTFGLLDFWKFGPFSPAPRPQRLCGELPLGTRKKR